MATKKEKEQQLEREPLKYIDFTYNGTVYTLEFNRRSAEYLEKRMGVNIVKTLQGDVNLTDLPNFFKAALMMHHPRMREDVADQIYDMLDNKQELLAALIEMMAYAVNSVFEEPEEGKAISWARH